MASQFQNACRPFADAALAAFPSGVRELARKAAQALATLVDDSYRQGAYRVDVLGEDVNIPYRLHFIADIDGAQDGSQPSSFARCLISRSTDGHLRQRALRSILALQDPWIIPFIVFPVGEYVVEIVEDIQSALPTLHRDAYVNFVRENRATMTLLRARATSYWDSYYRRAYPDRRDYPGMAVLNELERWAG